MKSNHIRVSAFFSVLFCLTAPAISQNTEIPSKPGSEHHISRDRGDNCPLGDVKIITKISQTEGNFTQALSSSDGFGMDIDTLGDFNHDGVMDFVVCATFDDDGASNAGAVYILFMNANGTVLSSKKISSTAGGFTGSLGSTVQFGASVSNIGDLDGDGTVDIAVGANQIDDGAHDMGAIFIIFLKPDGTVKSNQRISSQSGNFMGVLSVDARFGSEIENLGDTDGDGITDLAVGAHTDNPGGAFFIVRLNANGTVKNSIKITDGSNGFSGPLASGDYFGYSITKIGDLDHDGTFDLAVSAFGDDDGASTAGAVWILFMNPDMTVKSNQKISASSGGFTGTLISNSRFGRGLTAVRDVDSDTYPDIAVGENGQNRIWILTMNSNGTVKNAVPVDNTQALLNPYLESGDMFGSAIVETSDFFNTGRLSLAVGALTDDDGGTDVGAFYLLDLCDDKSGSGIDAFGSFDNEELITIYPNPFTETATVEFYNPDHQSFCMTLVDATGRTIRKADHITSGFAQLERNGLETGIYFLILSGPRTYHAKIIID